MKSTFLQAYWPVLIAVLFGVALGAAVGYFGQCTSGTCPLTSTWWRGALYGGVLGLLFGFSSEARNEAKKKLGTRPPPVPTSPASEHHRDDAASKDSFRPQ
jgi:uncharacterized membrane protein